MKSGRVLGLTLIAENLCTWNIEHPLPCTDPPRNGGFARWRDAAVLAKEAKDARRITDVEEPHWKTIAAYYLKIWDLEMQEAENPPKYILEALAAQNSAD